ncbi:hypothetical protein [Aquimarina sp. MMG016]|uniref:hypothetical protein n=1 Tax=Aquimarina sp. MMG016 TaxID=2822690 RepID=UPI001B3A71E5|nr:hypothetical protein [Aquimarina sp. MMG016]MBQ4818862.1 hypothetical protein [Aquimarina sp. MMG016]
METSITSKRCNDNQQSIPFGEYILAGNLPSFFKENFNPLTAIPRKEFLQLLETKVNQ